jgi:hypothetical protein
MMIVAKEFTKSQNSHKNQNKINFKWKDYILADVRFFIMRFHVVFSKCMFAQIFLRLSQKYDGLKNEKMFKIKWVWTFLSTLSKPNSYQLLLLRNPQINNQQRSDICYTKKPQQAETEHLHVQSTQELPSPPPHNRLYICAI